MFGDEEENANGPFARNKDGTAKDPKAFQDALKRDAEKLQMIEQDPELAKVLLGDDMDAFQETLKMVKKMEDQRAREYGERGIDCQRASARYPRDAVALYEGMYQAGLQRRRAARAVNRALLAWPAGGRRTRRGGCAAPGLS
ncbi:hypothetical protein RI054_05g29930 [Pseudoscourfieldia marina]